MSFGQNYNIFNDLHELQQMTGALKGYLRRDALYGTVGGGFFTGAGIPNFTIGTILLRLRRLHILGGMLDERRRGQLVAAQARHDEVRAANERRYVERLAHEAHSRLDAMKTFFEECREDPKLCPRIYTPEAFRRTVVAEVLAALDEAGYASEDLTQKVRATDRRLHGYVQATPFIWDDLLLPAYPERDFWWLYHSPPSQES